MKKIEVLYKKEYVGRIIFVIKYLDKVTFVYKSSGFSGTGHCGDIIPFMYLNNYRSVRGPMIGYIWKEYYFGGRYISHDKNFTGSIKIFLDELKVLLEDEVSTQTEEECNIIVNSKDFISLINEINLNLKKFEKQYGLLDYSLV